jgi:hypothetical protein
MQEKNATFLDFLRRTDLLAVSKGLNVGDLIPILDLSRATLFSYRSGKRPISAKAWMKLEAAERAAGINSVRANGVSVNSLHAERVSENQVTRDEITDKPHLGGQLTREEASSNQLQAQLIAQLAALTSVIAEQNKRIDALIEQRATSSSGHGRAVKATRKKLA